MSVYELARQDDFASMSLIVEDFAKDNGANHSGMFHVGFLLQTLTYSSD